MKALLGILLAAVSFAAAAQRQYEPMIPAPKYNDVMTPVVKRDLAGLRDLLALGRWADKPDSQGRTPLLVALTLGEREIADVLLRAGADPERALIAARRIGDRQMVAELESQAPSAGASGATTKK